MWLEPDPVDVHGHLGEAGQTERLGARLAREHAEPELGEAARGVDRAAVPGRGEDGVEAIAEQILQACAAGLDVRTLAGRSSRGPELALAPPLGLVVLV